MNIKNKLQGIIKINSERDFIIDEINNNNYTYKDLHILSTKVYLYFKKLNLQKNNNILIVTNNKIDTVFLYFGALYFGLTIIPVRSSINHHEFIELIELSNPSKIFFINDEDNIPFNDYNNKSILFNNKILNDIEYTKIEPFLDYYDNDTNLIIFSSGTSGKPKGIVRKFSTLVKNAELFNQIMNIDETNRFLNFLQLSYLGGYYNLLMLPFIASASVVLTKPFNLTTISNIPNIIDKYKINTLWLVPSIISIMNNFDRNNINLIGIYKQNIKLSLVGTAPLQKEIKEVFFKKYGLKLYENYGLSETLFISTHTKNNHENESVGKIFNNITITIDNPNNIGIGEIIVESPYMMEKYYEESLEDQNLVNSNVFKTGDIGYINNNYLYITDRKKDIIIRGGENISPREIENVIMKVNDVLEVAVIGIEHNIYGEDIIAYLVSNNNHNDSLIVKIQKHCKDILSLNKIPSKFIIIDELPKNLNGKIDKKKLKNYLLGK